MLPEPVRPHEGRRSRHRFALLGRVPIGRALPGIALLGLALLGTEVPGMGVPGISRAHAQTPEERCLLDALASAASDTTVAELRAGCRQPEASAEVVAPTEVVEAPSAGSPVLRRTSSEIALWNDRFALLPHRPNYLDPLSHAFENPSSTSLSDAPVQRNEVKFQLSFKLPLTPPLLEGRAALFFAYTGQSWWQAYNEERSSPFREYSHEPEIFVSWAPRARVLGWDWRLASAGFAHQSNGRSGDDSRSWNRIFAELRFDRPGPWWIGLRPWWRIPESEKPFPGSPRGDDNPDIERFFGDGELRLGHAGEVHNWTVMLRRSFASAGKGAVQIDYSRPTGFSPRLRWHLQYFDGYAETLLDYRTRIRRFGFGVMLNDWY